MSSIDAARRAKEKATEVARQAGSVVGVGLTKVGDSYAVKVNFANPSAKIAGLPNRIDGVPVVYEIVGTISPRIL